MYLCLDVKPGGKMKLTVVPEVFYILWGGLAFVPRLVEGLFREYEILEE